MIPDPAVLFAVEAEAELSFENTPVRSRRWHSKGAERFPTEQRAFESDLPALVREFITPGYRPAAGMLTSKANVVILGSCFARELRGYLGGLGLSSGPSWRSPHMNNSFAILDFVSWCITGEDAGRGYRWDRTDDGGLADWTLETDREDYFRGLGDADAIVLNFAFAEVWRDRDTGAVFWRGIPKDLFDADRHEIELTSVEENEQNMLRTIELIRSVNPTAPVVLLVGPGPLPATFRGVGCIAADCVSKSVLRVAVEKIASRRLEGVYYWPLFEIVRSLGAHMPWRGYANDDANPQHAARYLVVESMRAFIEAYCTPAAVGELEARRAPTVTAPASPRGRVEYPVRRFFSRPAVRTILRLPPPPRA